MLYLGNVFFTLGADTRGLSAAANRLRDFGNDIEKVKRYSMDGANQITAGLARQERAAISALDRVKAFQAQIARTTIPESTKRALTQDATALFDNLSRQLTEGKLNPLDQVAFQRSLGAFQSGLNDLKRNLREVQDASRAPPTRTWEAFRNNIRSVGHAALFTQGHLGGMSTRLFALSSLIDDFGLRTAIVAGGIAGFTAAVGILGSSMVSTAKKMQAIEKAFDAVSGSAAMTAYHFEYIQKVADQAGLVFTDISKSYTRFLAAGQAANLSLDTIQESFHGVALAAGILQLSVEDVQGVFKALEQIMSKGTVQSEELRGQLGDRFPAAFAIAAQAIGKTTAELSDMLKKGQVVSSSFVPKFVEAMKKVYNIDISKNVETIQAEQNRLTNEWVLAIKTLDDLLGVSRAWQNVLEALKNVLVDFRQNITTVAASAVALATAIATFWAIAYLPAAFAATLAFFTGLYRIILSVTTAVRAMTAAQLLLNVAMLANPAMALISLLARLAVALGAGVGAYKLMQSALKEVHDEMARGANREVDTYIEQQKKLLTATSAATNEFIKQQQVFAAQKMFEYIDAAKEAADAQKTLKETQEDLADVRSRPGRANMELASGLGAMASAQKKQVTEAQKAQQALAIEATKAQTRITELQKLYHQQIKLEEDMANAPAAAKDSKDKSDGLARIRDIIAAAQEARDVVQSIGEGGDPRFVRDLYDAKDALRELSAEEKAGAASLLGVANNAGAVETKLAALVSVARKGREEFSDFMRIWENIEDDSRELANMRQQLDYLMKGGNPTGLLDIQYLGEAQSILKNLSQTSLEAIRQKLASIGVYGDTAAAALAGFFAQQAKAEDLVNTMSDVNDEIRDTKDAIKDAAYMMDALNAGFMNGDAADEFIDRVKTLRAYARDLAAAGMPIEQIREVLRALDEQLRKQQDMEYTLERTRAAADRVKDSFSDMTNEALTGLREVLKGTKSLGDALMDLAYNIIDGLWESFIIGPAQDALSGMFRKQGQQGQGSATDTAVGQVDTFTSALTMAAEATKGTFIGGLISAAASAAQEAVVTNVATSVKASETAAIIAATSALAALTASAYAAAAALAGDEGGGGGGGWLGKLFKFGSQIAMAIGSEGNAAAGAGATISDGTGMNSPSPRRHGGPMLAGTIYSINEPGINGEYFIPAMNGYMSPEGGGGGSNITIDASTYIDARGATRETIAELRQEMDNRDRQMRQELPYLVDGRITQSSSRGRL